MRADASLDRRLDPARDVGSGFGTTNWLQFGSLGGGGKRGARPHPMVVSMGETLETARLVLAQWSDADAALLTRMSADPKVVRHIGDGRRWSADKAADVSRRTVEHWQAHGFGWRIVVEKSS